MNIQEFQTDLNNGMTLEKALKKHNTNLQTVFKALQYFNHNPHKTPQSGEKLIRRVDNGRYALRKMLKGHMHYYGTYDTIEDAVRVRDYMITYGWDNDYKEVARTLGVEYK